MQKGFHLAYLTFLVLLFVLFETVSLSFLLIGDSLIQQASNVFSLIYDYRSLVASLTIVPLLALFIMMTHSKSPPSKPLLTLFLMFCFRWGVMVSIGCIWIFYGK
jgi:hypothetical protein